MAYTASDLVNLEADFKSLKKIYDNIQSDFNEFTCTIIRIEHFLECYHDIESSFNIDDLPYEKSNDMPF